MTVEVKTEDKEPIAQSQNTQPNKNTQQPVAAPVEPVETDQEKNWKKFKEARAEERKQLEESRKHAAQKTAEAEALKAAMDAILNKNQVPQQQLRNDYDQEEETEEQRIEKHVKRALDNQRIAHEKQRVEEEKKSFPTRLANDFRDFDQVCSSSNLDYLDYHYPEVAEPFSNMPDGYEKWKAIYKAVKRFVPNTDSKKEANRADSNMKKPQSMSAPALTQAGDVQSSHKLDQKRKEENWARMQRTLKGLS